MSNISYEDFALGVKEVVILEICRDKGICQLPTASCNDRFLSLSAL